MVKRRNIYTHDIDLKKLHIKMQCVMTLQSQSKKFLIEVMK